jgi:hypothetical protein
MAYEKMKSEQYAMIKGINAKASVYVNGPMEFRDLKNVNFQRPGALQKREGTTFYAGNSLLGPIGSAYEWETGSSQFLVFGTSGVFRSVDSSNQGLSIILSNGQTSYYDFAPLNGQLWSANGQGFFGFQFRLTGFTTGGGGQTFFGATINYWGLCNPGYSFSVGLSLSTVGGGSLANGNYVFRIAATKPDGSVFFLIQNQEFTVNTATFGSFEFVGFTNVTSIGDVRQFVFYRSGVSNTDALAVGVFNAFASLILDGAYYTNTTQSAAASYVNGIIHSARINFNSGVFFPAAPSGFTCITPKYLEIYNNQLFMLSATSIVYFSEIGQAENVQPEYFFEVRTEDGDVLRGAKAFRDSLFLFKERSFHELSGQDPANFFLRQRSADCGALSNQAIVTFENRLWWLDVEGIVEWDGAGVQLVSEPIEPIFQRMNINAARDKATAVHYKDINEVWFAIPVDGATINNLILAYDYFVGAWTTYDGVDASTLFRARQNQDKIRVFSGGYTGSFDVWSSSFMADNGRAITCVVESPWFAPLGQSVEKLFRRHYTNVEPIAATQSIDLDMRSNYDSSTIVINRTIFQATFQTRIDFGIPAKSYQVTTKQASSTNPFLFYGYTIEYRFQRAV